MTTLRKRITAASLCLAGLLASFANADQREIAVQAVTVSCGEYHSLTGLNLCHVQTDLRLSVERYQAIISNHNDDSCLRQIIKRYGTLNCQSLQNGFQAWRHDDTALCAAKLKQCEGGEASHLAHRSTEHEVNSTFEARFIPLGRTEARVIRD